jgi:cyclopropane-fatty-acyl-phospholipid synthase
MRESVHSATGAATSDPISDSASVRAAPAADARSSGDEAVALATALLQRLFRNFSGALSLRLWSGGGFLVGNAPAGAPTPRYSLVLRSPGTVAALVLGRDPLRFAELFFRGDLDIDGDFFEALELRKHLASMGLPWRERIRCLVAALRLRALDERRSEALARAAARAAKRVKKHSKSENDQAIQFHYDISNEFYALWLDPAMVYSCAYFETPATDLAAAQTAKLEHICRKLRLAPGERLLDVGCGWGALLMHAARHHGVTAHGITLSQKQLDLARQRIASAGLQDRVTVEKLDYRDLGGEPLYDKVASVGMFEHVGLENLPVYFSSIQRVLKPGGLFLNHGITHNVEGWDDSLSTEFINRYVFPDGQLDTIGNIQSRMERAGFEIADVECLRPHYALTLRHWAANLERRRAEALEHVSEATYRVWRLYMSCCALDFEAGEISIYQVLAAKRAACGVQLPLTRRHLYDEPAAQSPLSRTSGK